MAEIKSTLDLIMERTKNLTMSDEEKRAFKARETAGKIKGLVQKHLDGLIDTDRFQAEVSALQREVKDDPMVDRVLAEECLDRIELDGNNERLFKMLETVTGVDAQALKEKLKEVENQLKREKVIRENKLASELKSKGISGSAVILNISADPGWNKYVGKMRQEFKYQVQGAGYRGQGKE